MLEAKAEPQTDSGLDSHRGHEATAHGPNDVITVPDAHLLFAGELKRAGTDLIISDKTQEFTVHDYFRGEQRPTLVSPEGATLPTAVVEALTGHGDYAQAAQAQNAVEAVGRVVKFTGSATIVRNGVAITVNTGDAVLKGDVLQTGAGNMVVTLNDGTTLNVNENSRLAVSEFLYDAKADNNSEVLNLVQGSLTFISGQIAHHGHMQIDTPVATMGIRGTAGDVGQGTDGNWHFTISSSSTPNDVTLSFNGQPIADIHLEADGKTLSVHFDQGQIATLLSDLTAGQQALLQANLQAIVSNQQVGQAIIQQFHQDPNTPNPQSPTDSHSSIQPIQIDLPKVAVLGTDSGAPIPPAIVTPPPTTTSPEPDTTPPPEPPPVIEVPLPTNLPPVATPLSQTVDDDAAPVQVDLLTAGFDVDAGDTLHIDSLHLSATDQNGNPLNIPVAYTLVGNQLTIDPSQFVSLAAGQKVILEADFNLVDSQGHATPTSATLTVIGINEAPTVSGPVTGAATEGGAPSVLNALANAADVDTGTTLSVVGLPGTLPAGVSYNAASHSFTLDPNNPTFQHLAQGEQTTVTVSYGVSDGTATTPASVSWTVTGIDEAPTVSGPVTGAATEGGAASVLNALANAADVDSGTTLSVVNVPGTLPAGVSYDTASHSFTLDPTDPAFQGLAQGAQTTVTVSYGVSDGIATTPASVSWTVTGINEAPVLDYFELNVVQGGTTVLTPSDFHITDPDSSSFFFNIQNVQGGEFRVFTDGNWVSAPTGGFTAADIAASHVEFVQDGSATTPSFSVNASDFTDAGPAISPTVNFETLVVVAGGAVQEGQQLQASVTLTGADASITNVTYQWESSNDGGQSWSPVSGAITQPSATGVPISFYQITEADEGKEFRAIASFTDANGHPVSLTSQPTVPAADVTPVVTPPFSYALDELTITKGGDQIYDNTFGQAPPYSTDILKGGTPQSIAFATFGSTWTEGTNNTGQPAAILSSTGVVPNNVTGSDWVAARLLTNTDPNSTAGLKLGSDFDVSATFDLTALPKGSYGLELNDATPSHAGDQIVQILVQGFNDGTTRIVFQQVDTTGNVAHITPIAPAITLTADELASSKIQFDLSHLANSNAITGSFTLLDSYGQPVEPTTTFSSTATIFTGGVNWTRADVVAFTGPGVLIGGVSPGQAPQAGQTLTALASTNDADATLHYQWQSSLDGTTWTPIASATNASYVVQIGDEGRELRVLVNTTDADNNQTASATSAATAHVGAPTATVTVVTPNGYDMHGLYGDIGQADIDPGSATSTHFDVVNTFTGHTFRVFGSNLSYNATGLTGGTVSEIDILNTATGATLLTITGFAIDAAALSAAAQAFHDSNDPTQLNAIFNQYAYDAQGGAGNDFLLGYAHADTFDGGGGKNLVDYVHFGSGITADLADPSQNTGNAAGDTYTNVVGFIGTNFNDILIGDGNSNALEGGAGADTLIGGGGRDFAAYFHAPSTGVSDSIVIGVKADLADPSQNTGDAAGDTYIGINSLIGSAFADTLIGDNNDNYLRGCPGGDHLVGGGGSDTADYNFANSVAGQGLVVDLSNPAHNTGDAFHDTYVSIENIRGSGFNDILKGDSGPNILIGQGGADTFVYVTGGGADVIADFDQSGGSFNHAEGDRIDLTGVCNVHSFADLNMTQDGANTVIHFGPGPSDTLTLTGVTATDLADSDFIFNPPQFDFLSWKNQIDPAAALAGSSTKWIVPNRDGLTSTVFLGTGFTYDPVSGLPTAGAIASMSLVDNLDHTVLQTMTNVTTTLGQLGAFVAHVESLQSTLPWFDVLPGDNVKPLVFSATEIKFANTDGTFTDVLGTGFAQTHQNGGLQGTVTGVQHLASDGTTVLPDSPSTVLNVSLAEYAEVLGQSDFSEDFYQLAGQGDNTLTGWHAQVGATNYFYDNLDATAGNDTIVGQAFGGGDTNSVNFVDYQSAPSAVNVNLATGAATGGSGNDTLTNIEGAGGSDFNDTLIGNDNSNSLFGGQGDDTLQGAGGNDYLSGGPGADALDGGCGEDTANYAVYDTGVGVRADLSDPSTNTGDAAGDTYISIEDLAGSNFDDILKGDSGANTLYGGGGADRFIYSGGADNIPDFDQSTGQFVGGPFDHGQGDLIDLTGSGVTSWQQLQQMMSGTTDTLIDFGNGNTITLDGVDHNNLAATDFVFDTNHAPTVSGPVTGTATEDGPSSTLDALADASDLDPGATLSVVNVPASLPAGVSFDGVDMFTLDPSDPAFQGLAEGAQTTVSVDYDVSDGTATTPASVSWTVTGVNDAPVLGGPAAFSSFAGGQLNDNGGVFAPVLSNSNETLQLTDGQGSEATSWFATTKVSVTGFTASFDYQATGDFGQLADGFAFVLQNSSDGPSALGDAGGNLGYGGSGAISNSAAVEFNLYAPYGVGTTFNTDGDVGMDTGYTSTLPVDFWDTGDSIHVVLTYSGSTLTETLTDSTAGTTYSTSYQNVDLAQIVGSDTAYVGFTAGTGAAMSTQVVSNFNFAPAVDFVPGQAPGAVDPAITLSDIDSSTLASAEVQITGGLHSDQDVLAFVNGNAAAFGDITEASYDQGTGLLTLTSAGGATLAQWQNALQAVTYSNTSASPSNDVRTVTFQVDDGSAQHNLSNVETASVFVAPADVAPTISLADAHEQPAIGGVLLTVPCDPISDPDAGNNPLTLTLNVADGTLSPFDPVCGLTVIQDGSQGVLEVQGTLAQLNEAMAHGVIYHPSNDWLLPETVNFTVDDGFGGQTELKTYITPPDGISIGDAVYGGVPGVVNSDSVTLSAVKLIGDGNFSQFGISVAGGDLNDDGHSDVIVGAPNQSTNFENDGAAYVVFGDTMPTSGTLHIADATQNHQAVALIGYYGGYYAGLSVAAAGDIHGDGFGNLLVGSPGSGSAYAISGGSIPATGPARLWDVYYGSQSANFYLHGPDQAGAVVADAGHVNGDAFDDFIVGAVPSDFSGQATVYVVYGQQGALPSSDLTSINSEGGPSGFTITNIPVGYSGHLAATGIDFNGDGYNDIAVGFAGPCAPGNVGGEVLFAGPSMSSSINANDVGKTVPGFIIVDASYGDRAGYSIANAGDVNGDGYDDLIIGAPKANEGFGAAYVVFGHQQFAYSAVYHANVLDLAQVGASVQGFQLVGEEYHSGTGFSVAGAGDVNGDGYADIVVGAPYADNYAGAAYIVFGDASLTGTIALADVAAGQDGTSGQLLGVKLDGENANDSLGSSVAGAGDVNGDGYADVVIGAWNAYDACTGGYTGAAYVVFGGHFTDLPPVVDLDSTQPGTGSQADVLPGASTAHVFGDYLTISDADNSTLASATVTLHAQDATDHIYVDTELLAGATTIDGGLDGTFDGLAWQFAAPGPEPTDLTLTITGSADLATYQQLLQAVTFSTDSSDDIDRSVDLVVNDGQADSQVATATVHVDQPWPGGGVNIADIVDGGFHSAIGGAPISLAAIELDGGFDGFGYAVASAGDVNGDGLSDVIVGAPYHYNGDSFNFYGAAYVIFGQHGNASATLDVACSVAAQDGQAVELYGYGNAGFSVGATGDIAGDGFDHLLVGAPGNQVAYSISDQYIGQHRFSGPVPVYGAYQTNAASNPLFYSEDHYPGALVAGAGDVNGDGVSDVIVGDASGVESSVYVVYGPQSGSVDVDSATTDGFKITGMLSWELETGNQHVSAAAIDFNGDGLSDIAVGFPAEPYSNIAGAAVYGGQSLSGSVFVNDIGTASGPQGFIIVEESKYNQGPGYAIANAGDVNGDGWDDMIISAPGANSGAGAAYVVFGHQTLPAGTGNYSGYNHVLDLAEVGTDIAGFKITGENPGDNAGFSVAGAGDVNGDGYADVIIGAPGADDGTGASYIVFGGAGLPSTVSLADVAAGYAQGIVGLPGIKLVGQDAGGYFGNSVAGAGDVNGDGFGDVIVGAPGSETVSGAAYIVLGGDFTHNDFNWVAPADANSANLEFTIDTVGLGVEVDWGDGSIAALPGPHDGLDFSHLYAPGTETDLTITPQGQPATVYHVTVGSNQADAEIDGTGTSNVNTGGNDVLIGFGSANTNTFVGNGGNDIMIASPAQDTFVFHDADAGHSSIVGFNTANDLIDVSQFFDDVNAVMALMHQDVTNPANTMIDLTPDIHVTLQNINFHSLTAQNFVVGSGVVGG